MAKELELTARQKTLLVFLGSDHQPELDPVRVMKGLFLISVETPGRWLKQESRYQFEPYTYGPCSFEIYSDLDQLGKWGYVTSKEAPGRSWRYYALSPRGKELARRVAEAMNRETVRYFKDVRDFVATTSFRQLLSVIYHHYPAYAVNSVFKL